ncbi:hypothetical protein [Rhodopila sp.]|uniref:hypothetical protein n=1 Tax=Rhodopila sp. TaxID=2480087 RepID=UPI003D0CB95C
MRIFGLAAIIAASALYALSASAQTTQGGAKPTQSSSSLNQPATKQATQGVPPSTANPQYGGARKQQTSVPTSLAHNPRYGGAQKQ